MWKHVIGSPAIFLDVDGVLNREADWKLRRGNMDS